MKQEYKEKTTKKIDFTYFFIGIIIVIGIIMRLWIYLYNQSFWLDECSLGLNIIDRNYIDLLKPLDHAQVAPPLFLVVSKFILDISHQINNIFTRDLILRFIPFLSSVIALPLFSIFVDKIFKNKYMTLSCTTMFALNRACINYAQEFKQYSFELLFTIILLLAFAKLDIKNISNKKLSLYSILFTISLYCSNSAIPILIVGLSLIIITMVRDKYYNKTKTLILFLPFIINIIIFYLFYYLPIHKEMYEYMLSLWSNYNNSFFTISTFLITFKQKIFSLVNIPFGKFFYIFLMFNVGILFIRKENLFKTKYLIIMPILFMIFASFFKIYPFEKRLILFLLPCIIIIFNQLFLIIKESKIASIILITTISFIVIKIVPNTIEMILHPSIYRDFSIVLKQENPTFKNVFFTSNPQIKYYIDKKHIQDRNSDNILTNLKDRKIVKQIDKLEDGEYFIEMFFALNKKNVDELVDFLKIQKGIEIIKIWQAPIRKEHCLIKIRKKNQ